MDFAPTPQHEEIRRTVRDFAERRIAPVADELERRGEFPHDIIREAAGLGLLGVPFPEDVGGTGLDQVAYAITVEELSRVSGSVGIIVSAHTSLGCNPIYLAGTDAQKERYLRPLASGAKLGAYGLTEPGAGSDSRGTRTSARRDGDCWVLNGGKRFITNAGVAGAHLVTPIPHRPRKEPHGPIGGRIGIASMALGLAQAAFEAAAAYARERRQFDRPIGAFQGVAFMIADMATRIDAARLMTYRAAWLKDAGKPYTTEAAMAKLFASEVARDVTNDAIQVHGGYGYVTEYHVERYLRDAKLTEIGEGTSQIQRLVIARNILGLRAM